MLNNITPTQTKTTQFGGAKLKGYQYDDLYQSYSQLTTAELEDIYSSKKLAGDRIALILENDGEYVDDGDGDVSWEGLWDGMRNRLNADLMRLTTEIQVISHLLRRNKFKKF